MALPLHDRLRDAQFVDAVSQRGDVLAWRPKSRRSRTCCAVSTQSTAAPSATTDRGSRVQGEASDGIAHLRQVRAGRQQYAQAIGNVGNRPSTGDVAIRECRRPLNAPEILFVV